MWPYPGKDKDRFEKKNFNNVVRWPVMWRKNLASWLEVFRLSQMIEILAAMMFILLYIQLEISLWLNTDSQTFWTVGWSKFKVVSSSTEIELQTHKAWTSKLFGHKQTKSRKTYSTTNIWIIHTSPIISILE